MIWWQPVHRAAVPMLSAIIATHESERALVPTLAALVPGVDRRPARRGGRGRRRLARRHRRSRRYRRLPLHRSSEPLGARLKAAAAATRAPWLMFLRAGCVPEPGWIDAAERFIAGGRHGSTRPRAAVFRPPGVADLLRPGLAELLALLRVTLGGGAEARAGPADRAALLRRARRPSRRRRRRGRAAAPARPPAPRHAGGGAAAQPDT